jgi:6-pyruvoyl-tetrahydropterin synthase
MPTLFVDQLTVIDFSYVDAERGILGESWIVDIVLEGELDDQGMVFDFGHVKKQIKNAIDEHYDHKLWFPATLPALQKKQDNNRCSYQWQDRAGRPYSHSSPTSAVIDLAIDAINTQQAAPLIALELQRILPNNVASVQLSLRPEAISGAQYQYSHGLQRHEGNCQRIAHGHRSALEIFRDGQRDPQLEQQWAEQWCDIYIGTRSHIEQQDPETLRFRYQAEQGEFALSLPAERCYLVDTESTVEYIAEHIAKTLKQRHPDSSFSVRAFEGVGKGAIASY